MKICYIGRIKGEILRRWVKWFADRGHEVHVICPHESSNISDGLKNVHVHKLDIVNSILNLRVLLFKSVWISIIPTRKIIKEINPDVVHGQDIVGFGLPTMFSGNYQKIISILGLDVLKQSKESIVYQVIVKVVAKKADKIHSFADNLTDELVLLGADKDKIITITPAVDTKNFNNYIDSQQIRMSLGWENNPIVISTRNIAPIYNIECFVNAMPIVIKEIPDAKFIIKMGHIDYEYWENKLKILVKELGISNSVKFLGYIPYDDLPKYLAGADVYVSTSLSDGLGISNIEALACGTPAVLADIDSTRNLIKKGLHAHLYPPKDSNALAKEIIASIKNKEKDNKEIHEKNFQIIKEHYDFDKNMEKIEQLYKDLIDKHKK